MKISEMSPDQIWAIKQTLVFIFVLLLVVVWGATSLLFYIAKEQGRTENTPTKNREKKGKDSGGKIKTLLMLIFCFMLQSLFAQEIKQEQINHLVDDGFFVQPYETISYASLYPMLLEIEKLSQGWNILKSEDPHIYALSTYADSIYRYDLVKGGYSFQFKKQELGFINYMFIGEEIIEMNYIYNFSDNFISLIIDNDLVVIRPGGILVYPYFHRNIRIIKDSRITPIMEWLEKP